MVLLDSFDFGEWTPFLNVHELGAAIERDQAAHTVSGPVTSAVLESSKHLGIVNLPGAMDHVLVQRSGSPIPSTAGHVVRHLGCSIPTYVKDHATEIHNQAVHNFPGLYKLEGEFKKTFDKAYFEPLEYFLQTGNRYAPPHIDHGHVLGFIPRYCASCLKVWVSVPYEHLSGDEFSLLGDGFMAMARHPNASVLIQRPGDIIYQAPLQCHAVMVAYKLETPDTARWCVIGGTLFIRDSDVYESYLYATRAIIGVRRCSAEAWARVLKGFCIMGNRSYNFCNKKVFAEAKSLFMDRVRSDARFNTVKSSNADRKHNKKRQMKGAIAHARAARFKKTSD